MAFSPVKTTMDTSSHITSVTLKAGVSKLLLSAAESRLYIGGSSFSPIWFLCVLLTKWTKFLGSTLGLDSETELLNVNIWLLKSRITVCKTQFTWKMTPLSCIVQDVLSTDLSCEQSLTCLRSRGSSNKLLHNFLFRKLPDNQCLTKAFTFYLVLIIPTFIIHWICFI